VTIYEIPFIGNQSLRNALTLKNIKFGFLVTGAWAFNTDMFTDGYFLTSAVTDRPFQDKKNLNILDSQILKLPTRVSMLEVNLQHHLRKAICTMQVLLKTELF
jgi:hypothetical protein